MLINSQFLDISCQFHMKARQTSAMYVPLSFLLKKKFSFFFFLSWFYVFYQHFLKINSDIFSAKLHDPWVKKHNKSARVTNFNVYTAASLRSLCQDFVQRTLLTPDEVPELIILKSRWLDDRQRIREKEAKGSYVDTQLF